MALKLITPPSIVLFTAAEVRTFCRFDPTDLDADIDAMVIDAMRLCEHETGQCLLAQTWELSLDAFPDAFELTRIPVASITSIIYADATGAQTTLNNSLYTLDSRDGYGYHYVVPAFGTDWPATRAEINAVKLRYVAGYPDAASVPSHLKREVKINIAKLLYDPAELSDRLRSIEKVYAL